MTGGIAHALALLEGSFLVSSGLRVPIVIQSRHHKPLGYREPTELFEFRNWPRVELNDPRGSLEKPQGDLRTKSKDGDGTTYWWRIDGQERQLEALAIRPLLFQRHSVWTIGKFLPERFRYRFIARDLDWSIGTSRLVAESLQRMDFSFPRVAVHVRHSDKRGNVEATIEQIKNLTAVRGQNDPLFLSTDSREVESRFQDVFGVNRVHFFHKPVTPPGKNLHYGVTAEMADHQFIAALVDLYCLSKARHVVSAAGVTTGWTPLLKVLRSPGRRALFSRVDSLVGSRF